jgi:outer membrane protein
VRTIPRTFARIAMLALTAGWLAGAGPAAAPDAAAQAPATAAATRAITFREAIALALARNATLRRAGHAAEAEDIGVWRAKLDFLPRLSASAQGSQEVWSANGAGDPSLSAGLSADLTLFDGFGNVASLRRARLARDASRSDVQQSRRAVVVSVVSNVLALIQQKEQLRVQQGNLAAADSLERQIGEYVSAGARTVADLYQQQATAASARLAVVEADRAVELARADLMQTLQLEAGEAVEFEVPALRDEAHGAALDLDSLLARAYAQRADLAAEGLRAAAAKQGVRVAGSAGWPSLSLSAGYGSSFLSGAGDSFSEQFHDRRSGSLGIGLSLPIFDRGANRANLRLSRIEAENRRLTLETTRQAVGFEVQRAWLSLRAAVQQREAAEAQDRAAERALATSQERYRAGAATFVELAQARAARVQAASALVSARYNLIFQRAVLDYAVGEDDPAASLLR